MTSKRVSDKRSVARPSGMTNQIKQDGDTVSIKFILSPEETETWRKDDWRSASARGGVKREARALFRDVGRKVEVVADDNTVLWSSDGDAVCVQVVRNGREA